VEFPGANRTEAQERVAREVISALVSYLRELRAKKTRR